MMMMQHLFYCSIFSLPYSLPSPITFLWAGVFDEARPSIAVAEFLAEAMALKNLGIFPFY